MAAPDFVQTKAATAAAGVTTREVTFDTAVTEGNTLLACVMSSLGASGTPIASVVAEHQGTSAQTAMTVVVQDRWKYEQDVKQGGIWKADNLPAGTYKIIATAGASASMNLLGIEAEPLTYEIAPAFTDSENGAAGHGGGGGTPFGVTVGPVTPTGETRMVAMSCAAGDSGDIGWIVDTGWTELIDNGSLGSGLIAMHVVTRTVDTTDPQTVDMYSTANDAYGRIAVMAAFPASALAKEILVVNEDNSCQGLDDITVDVFKAPTTGRTGPKVFDQSSMTWDETVTVEGVVKARMRIPVPSGVASQLAIDETVVIGGGGDSADHGFTDFATGTVVEAGTGA